MASIPAVDLNEDRLKQSARLIKVASYQVVNFGLVLACLIVGYGWWFTARALDRNSQAIAHFAPIVVRENELGQTQLLTHQDINFTPDERAIRSALQFWAVDHLSKVKATIVELRSTSFSWMSEEYAAAVKSSDRQTQYIESFLADQNAQQYKVDVSNVVLKTMERKPGRALTGTADIYAVKTFLGDDGIPQLHKAADSFIVNVRWAVATEVPNDIQGLNPLGIAVTHYDVFNSLQ